MAIIFYQLAIVATLVFVRIAYPKLLLIAALGWSCLTAVNLFFPPLIIIQLAVVWSTYSLLKSRRKARSQLPPRLEAGSKRNESENARSGVDPVAGIFSQSGALNSRVTSSNSQPSWANTDRLSQFKAGVLQKSTDQFSVPLTYAMEFLVDPSAMHRLLKAAANEEDSGRSFEEQQVLAALMVREAWSDLSSTDKAGRQANEELLGQIRF